MKTKQKQQNLQVISGFQQKGRITLAIRKMKSVNGIHQAWMSRS